MIELGQYNGKPASLEIEGTLKGQRFLIRVNDVDVWLPQKSFKYIATLAVARYQLEDGWINKTDIEAGTNQVRYLYKMKRDILDGLNGLEWDVYESYYHSGEFRLAIEARFIKIRFENLVGNNDQEVRKLAIHEVGKHENL